jgi:hypothetical protein
MVQLEIVNSDTIMVQLVIGDKIMVRMEIDVRETVK